MLTLSLRAVASVPPRSGAVRRLGGERRCLSQLPMTSTAGAFVSNAASRAHTRVAFARNATTGTVSAVTTCFAPAHAVASRCSHHEAAHAIARRLADCAHATLLSLRRKVRDASALSRGPWLSYGEHSDDGDRSFQRMTTTWSKR